jgi:prepilin-type N-terminal cleavage/methylation domain-containing protein
MNADPRKHRTGFSLMEMLVTVAIIGTIAVLLIPSISPMKQGSSVQVARQQQAELQTALGSWIAAASAGPGGLAAARGAYNSAGSKLGLLQNYLQPATYAMFSGGGSSVTSEALTAAGASLQFSSWGMDTAPAVTWVGQ